MDEIVKVRNMPGGKFRFIRFEKDAGGDYAVVVGGLRGHRMERCVTVDRLISTKRKPSRRTIKTETGT